MRPSLSDEQVAEIRRLAGEGVSRDEIARRLDVGRATVSKYAPPGSFDRSATQAASEARLADLRALRQQLVLDLLKDAARLREQIWLPHTAFAFGGKDNTYNEHEIGEPTAADKRNLVQAAATAIDRAMKLLDYDSAESPDAARSMLGKLADALHDAMGDGGPQ